MKRLLLSPVSAESHFVGRVPEVIVKVWQNPSVLPRCCPSQSEGTELFPSVSAIHFPGGSAILNTHDIYLCTRLSFFLYLAVRTVMNMINAQYNNNYQYIFVMYSCVSFTKNTMTFCLHLNQAILLNRQCTFKVKLQYMC